MSRYIRPRIPGARIFFTVALQKRGSTVLTDEIARLRVAVAETRADHPFAIDAWVVLPDHLHAVWTLPVGDSNYGQRWGAIKSRFSRSLRDECKLGFNPAQALAAGHAVGWNPTLRRSPSKLRKGDAGIWQRRFWEHHLRSEADMAACIRYCHLNPVKHGLVTHPQDWPFSSLHRDLRTAQPTPKDAR